MSESDNTLEGFLARLKQDQDEGRAQYEQIAEAYGLRIYTFVTSLGDDDLETLCEILKAKRNSISAVHGIALGELYYRRTQPTAVTAEEGTEDGGDSNASP